MSHLLRKQPLQPDAWFNERSSGVLLHASSLPGTNTHGRLGEAAFRFVEFLSECGMTTWQMLPLGPVNATRSPYQALSLLAGNPAFIDIELAMEDALLPVNHDGGTDVRHAMTRAFAELHATRIHPLRDRFEQFKVREASWLPAHALFLALDRQFEGRDWTTWPDGLRDRRVRALRDARDVLADAIEFEMFLQWMFDRSWRRLRHFANSHGIHLMGDLAFYPAHHSADVWLHRDMFDLEPGGQARSVGGVPPDYFSDSGQLWGTPVYDWQRMQDDDFDWWRQRFEQEKRRFDLLRIDHFRGLSACWTVPAGSSNAVEGEWRVVPGRALLERLAQWMPELEIVVEDLGIVTSDVEELRDDFGLPGMRVLQFGFDGDPLNPHHVANVPKWSVLYTGTHDNNTLRGWWSGLDDNTHHLVHESCGHFDNDEATGVLRRHALASSAQLVILPMQDLLELTSAARMNTPGTVDHNWRWRLEEPPPENLARRIADELTAAQR